VEKGGSQKRGFLLVSKRHDVVIHRHLNAPAAPALTR
jgi:hypothetical protein